MKSFLFLLVFASLEYAATYLTGCSSVNPGGRRVALDPTMTPTQIAIVQAAAGRWVSAVGNPAQLSLDVQVRPCEAYDVCILGQHWGATSFAGEGEATTRPQPDGRILVTLNLDFGDEGTLSHATQHEFGHVLGLGHTGPGTVMYGEEDPVTVQETAAQDVTAADVSAFRTLWGY